MPNLRDFAVDQDKGRDGVWVPVGPNFYMRICYSGHPAFMQDLDKRQRPYRAQIARGTIDGTKFVKESAAYHLCKGWGVEANGARDFAGNTITDAEDLLGEEGEVVPCTVENKLKLFNDERYPEFWRSVDHYSTQLALFHDDDLEEAVGNSRASSDGTPPTEEI